MPCTQVHVFSDSRDVSTVRRARIDGCELTFTPKHEPIRSDPFHLFIPARRRLAPHIAAFDPHVIVGFGAETGCGLLATKFSRPSVVFIQGILEFLAPFDPTPKPAMWLHRRFEKQLPHRATALIAETEFARAWALHHNPRANVRVIPHPVAPQQFSVSADYAAPRVLCVGSLVPVKGVDIVLSAFASCTVPGAELVIAGDGPERMNLESRARELGISNRVRFVGFLDRAALAAEFARARVFVMASRMDTSPNALTEAHAAALPVIATRAGGIPEMVDDGRDGLLVNVDDHAALARGMNELLPDAARCRAMGAAGKEKVRALNDPARIAVAWRSLLDEVATRSTESDLCAA